MKNEEESEKTALFENIQIRVKKIIVVLIEYNLLTGKRTNQLCFNYFHNTEY